MKTILLAVILFVACISPLPTVAQSFTIKETAKSHADYSHEFFRPVPDRIMVVQFASPHGAFTFDRNTKNTEVIGYDTKLKELYTVPVKPLTGNAYLGGIELDNTLHILYSDKTKVLRCALDPATGAVKGEPTEVLTASKEPIQLIKGFSADSAYFYIMFKCGKSSEKHELFEGVIFGKDWTLVNKFSFTVEDGKMKLDNTSCLLSNEGLLFVINGVKAKSTRKEYKPLQYFVTEISKDGKNVTTQLTELPNGELANIVWRPTKNGLSFTGLLSPSSKDQYTIILSGEFNSWQKKLTNVKKVPLTEGPFWQNASGKILKGLKKIGIHSRAKLLNKFQYEDGSLVMVLQPTTIVQSSSGRSASAFTFYLYVLKITPNQELGWLQIIPLNQLEPFWPIYSSAVVVQKDKKDLHFFFHDHEKNAQLGNGKLKQVILSDSWDSEIQFVAATMGEDGSVRRTVINQNLDPDHHFSPRNAVAVYGNEIIYTSYNRRNAGKSTYKLGVIRIK